MNLQLKIEKNLLIVLLASFCLLISTFSWWLSTPLQWKINGYAIPIIEDVSSFRGFTKSFKPLSFGAISFLLFTLSIVCYCIKPLRKVLFILGMCGLVSGIYFLIKFTFLDITGANEIKYQQDQFNNMLRFSTKFLTHSDIDQATAISLSFNNTIEKIIYFSHWISIGFYTNLLGSFLLLKASKNYFQKHYKTIAIISILFSLCAMFAIFRSSITSEIYLLKADKYLFSGSPEEAIDYYRKAKLLNPNFIMSSSYIYKLGFANYLIRKSDSSVHFFKGNNYASRTFGESLNEFNISQEDSAIKKVISREKVSLFTDAGLKNYEEGYEYAAISNFIKSTKADPWQNESYFFLSKSYLDIQRYDQRPTVTNGSIFLSLCNERLLRADMYNMLGDSMYKSLDFAEARDMYDKSRKSFKLIRKTVNYNGMKGLQGL